MYHDEDEAYSNLITGGKSGFNADLSGKYSSRLETFVQIKKNGYEAGYYWSATDDEGNYNIGNLVLSDGSAYLFQGEKSNGRPIRCIKK